MSKVVLIRDDAGDWRTHVKAELNRLGKMQIRVGILGSADGELLRIAYVQEFGATITPKSARNLAIPLKPSVKGKSPREIPDTFVISNSENRFIARRNGRGQVEYLYLLTPKVVIPERSFIRAGYDNGKDKIAKACELAVRAVVFEGLSAEAAAERIGVAAIGVIKRYMRSGALLPKSSLTLASAPGKTTPLIQSGRLANSISYEVIT